MKKYFLFIILFCVLAQIKLNAQDTAAIAYGSCELNLSKDTIAAVRSFSGKYNSGNIYLKWTVTNQHTDGLYIIYHSYDGISYSVAGYKKAIGVSVSNDIAYYFTDQYPSGEIVYYKLICIQEDSSFIASEQIQVYIGSSCIALNKK